MRLQSIILSTFLLTSTMVASHADVVINAGRARDPKLYEFEPSASFDKLSPEEQKNERLHDFLSKKRAVHYKKFRDLIPQTAWNGGVGLAMITAGCYSLYDIIHNPDDHQLGRVVGGSREAQIFVQAWNYLTKIPQIYRERGFWRTLDYSIKSDLVFWGGLLYGIPKLFYTLFVDAPALYYAYHDYKNAPADALEPLERRYVLLRHLLSKDAQKSIEGIFDAGRAGTPIPLVTKMVETIINLEHVVSPLNVPNNMEQFKKLFGDYDAPVQQEMLYFIMQQLKAFEEKGANKSVRQTYFPLYMLGKPGTGKTEAVKRLANYLGIQYHIISVDGKSARDLVGSDLTSDSPTPGWLTEAVASAKGKPVIIFLDEIDRSKLPLSFFLKLFDPEARSFTSPFLKDYKAVKMDNVILIAAGNSMINDEAFQNRVQVVLYEGFAPEVKERIVWEKINEKLSSFGLTPEDFNEDDRILIRDLIQKDKDRGLRTMLKLISEIMRYKVSIKRGFGSFVTAPDFSKRLMEMNQQSH